MLGVQKLLKFLEVVVITGKLKGEKPVSTFLIADAESGKSQLIQTLQQYKNTYYVNDMSYKPLVKEIIPRIKEKKTTHILIPDFINVVAHETASKSLIPAFSSLMEEGMKEIKFYGMYLKMDKPINCAIITGITKYYFDKHIMFWRKSGFLTRMLPVTYSYSEFMIKKIHEFIQDGRYIEKDKTKFKNISDKNIIIPDNVAERVNLLAQGLADYNEIYYADSLTKLGGVIKIDLESYGFRIHRIVRTLLKALVVYESNGKRNIATIDDVKELKELLKYANWGFNPL